MRIDNPRKLAQVTPDVTTPITVWQNTGILPVEITTLILVTTPILSGSGSLQYSIYHDDTGTTYDISTLLAFDVETRDTLESGAAYQSAYPGGGIVIQPGGSLGFEIDTVDAAALTIYGGELVNQSGIA